MTIANILLSLNDKVQKNKGQSILITLFIAPLVYILVNELVRHNARISNLDGPWGLPLIGNIRDIKVNASEKYREWAKKYGPVYQIQLGNIPIVVVNSAAAARHIFGANAQALSSRPEFYTFHKVNHTTPNTCQVWPLTRLGSLGYRWHHNRHFPIQRLPQTPSQGCRLCPQPTFCGHICRPSRRRNP